MTKLRGPNPKSSRTTLQSKSVRSPFRIGGVRRAGSGEVEITHHSCVRAPQESEDEEDEEEEDDDDEEEEEDDENGDSSEDGGDSSESSSEDESEDGDEVRRQHGGRGSWAGRGLPRDWTPYSPERG